jgi:hypothetical protein
VDISDRFDDAAIDRTKVRREIIERLLPKANAMDSFRYIYGGHDEILWYGLIEEDRRSCPPGKGVQ